MQVHRGEGIANHIGLEPCVSAREDVGEASVGERIGQPLSLENILDLGAGLSLKTHAAVGKPPAMTASATTGIVAVSSADSAARLR